MYGYPVPNYINSDSNEGEGEEIKCGRSNLIEECNFAGYFDRIVLGKHLMSFPFDSEGTFTTLTAFVNTFSGLLFCLIMKKFKDDKNGLLMR